ncbi:g7707 [Coccomyxa viridis]|uniref:G7707 protein n=1 Tax=Coccomyxa viridis TaxID=1274662 RepID=A0ABP1G3F5_9CHLO
MAAGGADLPQLIVEAVREKARTVRALRTKWALLARDLLALATGMRTAVMLDYVALQPEALLDLVGTVAGICHEAGQHMVVGVWDSCCYVLRRDLLAERACNREAVLWLKLVGDGPQKHMRPASPLNQEAVQQQVEGLLRLLHSANPAQDVCNLATCDGYYIMPTLNGWLLGYPVVYLADEATVQATADHLSSQGVVRHIAMAANSTLKAACQRSGLSNNAAFEELEVLLSFTVPVEAADAGKGVALLQWVSGLQSSLECQASVGWGNFRVECEETSQRMQL